MWIVYAIVNQINSKTYFGQTSRFPLSKRWRPTLTNSPNPHLQAAIRKYGPNNFTRRVVACASCQEEADLLEKFFIMIFQTCNPRYGYNQQTGGLTGKGRHSKETIERIREGKQRFWAKKDRDAMILLSENARLRWDMWPEERKRQWAEDCRRRWWSRTPEERNRIIDLVRQHTRGRRRSTPMNLATKEEHRAALKRYWAQKRLQTGADLMKKPVAGTNVQKRQEHASNAKETRAAVALKEVEQAQCQLREIKARLDALTFELEGGCIW